MPLFLSSNQNHTCTTSHALVLAQSADPEIQQQQKLQLWAVDMASTPPVPSKAALNALRGVLLTTSCSVAFLAEERRRRLKIARAAIDNARKLHTVKSNRGAVALSESWDDRLADLGGDVLSLPAGSRPRSSFRRRRRGDASTLLANESGLDANGGASSDQLEAQRGGSAGVEQRDGEGAQISNFGLDAVKLILPLADSRLPDLSIMSLAASTLPIFPHNTKETGAHKVGNGVESRVKVTEMDKVARLEQLVKELEMSQSSRTLTAEMVDAAVAELENISTSKPTTPGVSSLVKSSGLRLLRLTVNSDTTKTINVLAALFPHFKDSLQLLSPLTKWLWEKKDKKEFERLLQFLSDTKQSRFWMQGMTIYRVLSGFDEVLGSFKDVKHLYRLLQSAGLYQAIAVPSNIEYKIRRLMVSKALKAGDDAFAQEEMGHLLNLDADAARADVKLQSRLIVREAALGHWEAVRKSIEALEDAGNAKPSDLRYMIGKITDVFVQTCSSEGLEALLRRFVRSYNIPLRSRWVNLVLDQYASRHDLDSMFSWLQFCRDAGFKMDDSFVQRFYAGCRKYWSFSNKHITNLHQTLRELAPAASKLTPSKFAGKVLNDAPPASLDSDRWVSEADAFECMEWLSAQNDWDRVCEAYSRLLSSGMNISVRCLRLAVLGHLKRPNGSIDAAAALIDDARGRGYDVTEALTPLLLARLENGDDAGELIKQALRRGSRVHDSVYNKAAQMLSAKGDLHGAATMCEVAARENGNGELLYSEYNFSNLVFAYTGSASYGALKSILAKFTSEVQWWRGSRACKESIKLAMKTTAMRAVVDARDKNDHRDALFKLDEALIHVKKCRSTREDRRAVTEAFIRVVRPAVAEGEQQQQQQQQDAADGRRVNLGTGEEPALEMAEAKPFQRSVMGVRQGLAAVGEA
ncbi:hypothetical protein M440DRAFT_1461133 [Trichoderma longibrachiatum ATCC 18648]|uniref:Pentacotripeptide-repeat region of PRORP domain-containing protein n=1 Tax=Trichoderma longibrachiatum ATCC 18648 TaxID=983965 RepID=A0A2T4CDQ1_TRILO|nr:hypothetical protein M440DRAFT_1461133 [Trichoderma longibrachiatum ATCC 18648]